MRNYTTTIDTYTYTERQSKPKAAKKGHVYLSDATTSTERRYAASVFSFARQRIRCWNAFRTRTRFPTYVNDKTFDDGFTNDAKFVEDEYNGRLQTGNDNDDVAIALLDTRILRYRRRDDDGDASRTFSITKYNTARAAAHSLIVL